MTNCVVKFDVMWLKFTRLSETQIIRNSIKFKTRLSEVSIIGRFVS